jgi:general stress protein 26
MVHDTVRKAAAWSKMIEIWFPGGKTDPAVVILDVTPEKAEFWDGPSNFLSQIYAYAKAAGTGNTEAFGTHAKLDLQ